MPTFVELLILSKEFLPVITACGTAISAVGLTPRIGPGRAAWIALRSRFAPNPVPQSIRLEEIDLLKATLIKKDFNQGYIVVTGPKGVGKTCLLRTVTSKTPGVIRVEAQPWHKQDDIILNTLKQLTRMPYTFLQPFNSAERVIFWHRLFTFGQSPIVVINATEREAGEGYAGLTGAVRTLVDNYNLRVIVDSSPNSLNESLLQTHRERIFQIKPMSKEMIWQLTQFQALFKTVKEAQLDDTVFAVLGGIPSKYDALWDTLEIALSKGQDARQVIGTHLCAQILDAIKLVEDSCGNNKRSVAKLIKIFQESEPFLKSTLVENNLERHNPEKVFRVVEKDDLYVLAPASNAIELVLRYGLTKKPTLHELEKLAKSN